MIGFVTQTDGHRLTEDLAGGKDRVAVYVQMSYQIGGFAFFLPRNRITPVDMDAEQAMRFVLTAGMSADKRDEKREPDSSLPPA